ncbi:MAG TPA: glucose-6-phosphate dehydrogenase assembly protein OpcA [Solirubrobacteraceae bacterium]|jgi:glucose-6-phosphate dehydrogenase assembly protein OpcA|nr:glucose-6-phosphate dehydrogenase assembly protein OpcA [Solirubrobacteraceae bacterium]
MSGAGPRSDAVWSAQGTTPDAIEAALRQLLIEVHAEHDNYVPARVLNMIAFVDREWSGEIANRLRGVGRYHASRLVVLAYEPKRERLDARVMITSAGESSPGEIALLHETVVVELGDRHLDDLLTIADPLVVTDLPTLLWSPHGHHEIVAELLALSQAVLLDSVEEPSVQEALDRACSLSERAYVVDLAWLRSTPWRERLAASFDPPQLRRELPTITSLTVRHHPASTVAAMLLAGWLASRLGWTAAPLLAHGDVLAGKAHVSRQDVGLRLEAAPELLVPGLEGLTIETASGRSLRLDRGPGGLHARTRSPRGNEHAWTIPGASRGETGVLGEGIRQALLRDPTYVPALKAARAMAS